jgi:two-component system, chemotaxis family, protein-glutamate methylesterase/glutaminase
MSSSRLPTVLVVDDSAFMRKLVSEMIEGSGEFRVIGTARNGLEALKKIHSLDPDLVTLDIEMPELDGIGALGYIMSETPRPVVMLSGAASESGRDPAIRALELGAVDFVKKPGGPISLDLDRVRDRLLDALRASREVNLRGLPMLSRREAATGGRAIAGGGSWATRAVTIAASTGGPRALADLIPALRPDLDAAVLIVQHMPAGFTKSLADRLDLHSRLSVAEASDGERVVHNRVYLAPGGQHMRVRVQGGVPVIALDSSPPVWGVRPPISSSSRSPTFSVQRQSASSSPGWGETQPRGCAQFTRWVASASPRIKRRRSSTGCLTPRCWPEALTRSSRCRRLGPR